MIERDKKKELVAQYKQKKTKGGVYKITNTANGRYLIKAEVDLQSFQNRFQFAMKMNSCIHPKLQKDFNSFGAEVFSLEFLEEVTQKEEESTMGFRDRLKRLEKEWLEKNDVTLKY